MTILSGKVQKALGNFRGNELVILPGDGDFGFQEYFDRKTEVLMRRKKLHSALEDNQLLLAFPPPDSKDVVFLRFFESPVVKARGGAFSGCFAIDVTDYADRTDDERFVSLMDYVRRERNVHFMLLLFSPDRKKAERLHGCLMSHGLFDVVRFDYPAAEDLAAYIVESFYAYYSETPDEEIAEHVSDLLSGRRAEYEYADSVVNELVNRGCATDPEELEKMLTEIILREPQEKTRPAFGFTGHK